MKTLVLASRIARGILTPVLFVLCVLALGVQQSLAGEQLYTCGMHPQIIKHEPGDCPICGMKLTPVRATGGSAKAVQVDTATVQRMNLKTATITSGSVRRELRTVGAVAFNEAGLLDVTLRYEAWIEKLHVATTWASVREGEALAEIYSPELYNAELNLLVARRTEGESGGPLTEAATARLQLLGLPADELAEILRTQEVPRTRTVKAPAAGVVIEKMALPGQMMKPGERFYRLADMSTVWVTAQIQERDMAFLKRGQEVLVSLTYGAGVEYKGRIELIVPQLDEQTRTASARVVLANPDGSLRPGMFADVRASLVYSGNAVLVPESAVLRSGERNTVFIALPGGNFEPREVILGLRSDDGHYEVKSGLMAGERIVTSGQFMLDSESQLREAIDKMTKGEGGPAVVPTVATPPAVTAGPGAAGGQPAVSAGTLFTCPMEEDLEVVEDKAGRCPKCGMKLVPTSEVEHGRQSKEAWRKRHASHSGHGS